MKRFLSLISLFLSFTSFGFCEVPWVTLSPENMEVSGVKFGVHYINMELRHDQFEIRHIVVAVYTDGKKMMPDTAHVRVWNDETYIYDSSIPTTEYIPNKIREQITSEQISDEPPLLFSFRINPLFLENSIFSYQLRDAEGRAIRDCHIYLKNFIE